MTARPDAPRADSDPTHALDDFLLRMRPAAAARDSGVDDPTDLSALTARLHPVRATSTNPDLPASRPTASPKGGTLRNGERWQADDVTDVPLVELPRVRPAAAPRTDDAALLHGIGRQASAAAATAAESTARGGADWQPDLQVLQLRHGVDPRVLARWQPGAWIGAQREVLQASTEFVNPGPAAGAPAAPVVEHHEALRLLVLWAPPGADAPHPGRWPLQVLLVPVPAEAATQALLAARPDPAADAPLWLDPDPARVDWALAAEIALHHVPGLRPFQIEGLRAFIEAEREATFGRINDGYGAVSGGAAARTGPAGA